MDWCRISINSGGKWLSEPPKLIIWNLNLETLASFKKMFNQQLRIPDHCMSCIRTWLILCRSMVCMWQGVHIYIYLYSHDVYWLAYNMNITDIHTHIYTTITWYCKGVRPVCLSATMFAGLQELEEDMIWPFTLRHAANAGVLNRPNNTINKCGFEIKRPFSAKWIVLCFHPGPKQYSIGFQYVITAALQCQTCQGGFETKNASASKRYCCTSHLRPLFGKTPNDGRTLTSMPNNITCRFKLLIS